MPLLKLYVKKKINASILHKICGILQIEPSCTVHSAESASKGKPLTFP